MTSVIIPNNNRDISFIREALRNCDVEIIEVNLGRERSYQRNQGIIQAEGKYILMLDSDQVPDEKLIDDCVAIMEANPECQGLYIPEIIIGDNFFTRLRNYERQFYTGTAVDCVRFVRNPCPLFDETMSGPEDADWDLRITGLKLISNEPLYHFDNITFKEYVKKKSYYTKSMKRFREKHPKAKVLDLFYRCFWVFFEKRRRIRPLFICLMFLIFIRGVIYLDSYNPFKK
jgi:glycosyltransferase involved in cell wall biosynthesis